VSADIKILDILNQATPDELVDALRKIGFGDMLDQPVVRTFTGLSASATFDLDAIDGTGEVVGSSNPMRRKAHAVLSARVTASGTGASVGTYLVTPDINATKLVPPGGASVAVGIATISVDGKTITFPNTVTAFVIAYVPAPKLALATKFAQ
jgi:hypothetical protein